MALAGSAVLSCVPHAAAAQTATPTSTISDVLSFLLTNRSVSTGDFDRDTQAALATRDAISGFLVTELGTLPISSSSGGFVYQLSPELGVSTRVSDSFGPFFTNRSLTNGRHGLSFGLSYQSSAFNEIDGRGLRDGKLIATSATLKGESTPFDLETLTLRLRTDTLVIAGNFGVSNRFDVGAAVPIIRLSLSGTRVDTYRGSSVTQAVASGSSVGAGDLILHGKLNVYQNGGSGIALGLEGRLPTGSKENLLGTGEATVTPRLILSIERARAGVHLNAGSAFGGESRGVDYRGAVTIVAAPRLTLVLEAAGRRLSSGGRLIDVTAPHPTVANVQTTRLSSADEATRRLVAVGGFKWNVSSTWLLTANVLRPLTQAGLTTSWTPTVTLDYSFGR